MSAMVVFGIRRSGGYLWRINSLPKGKRRDSVELVDATGPARSLGFGANDVDRLNLGVRLVLVPFHDGAPDERVPFPAAPRHRHLIGC